jgi:hypothetical protein
LKTLLPALAVALLAAFAAPLAQAAPVTLGSPLTGPFEIEGQCNFALGCEQTALDLAEPGAVTASPIAGTVVRWRAQGTTAGDEYRINVLRPNASGTYTETAVSPAAVSAGATTETFSSDLPIAVGEYVALSLPVGAGLRLLESPGPTIEIGFEPPLALGAEAAPIATDYVADEAAFDAEVEPSAPAPTPGPSPVGFGPRPGPPVEAPQCVVPRLGAKRLPAARKKLVAAHCRLGKVRGKRTRSALVVGQSPQTGAHLAAGAKVGVTLRTPPGSSKGGKR